MKQLFSEINDILRYRGGPGHWSYLLHRLTGLGVLLFLCVHIIDTVLIGWGPELFNKVIAVYRHPFFRLSEIFLFGAVLYHSLNGLRITLIDLWPGATRRHRLWAHLTWGLFVAAMIPVAIVMLHHWKAARP